MIEWDDLPKEIQEKMLDEQEKQGNGRRVYVFRDSLDRPACIGGFDWELAVGGYDFWLRVLKKGDFSGFYEKYPKIDDLDSSCSVNHPKHYTSHPSGVECIDITKHYDFCVGNAIKYLWRQGLKGGSKEKQIEDCKKAIWYINKHIENLENED